jgi:hypothetical protein
MAAYDPEPTSHRGWTRAGWRPASPKLHSWTGAVRYLPSEAIRLLREQLVERRTTLTSMTLTFALASQPRS